MRDLLERRCEYRTLVSRDQIVIVDPGRAAFPGSMVLVRDSRRGLLRKVAIINKGRLSLVALNAEYDAVLEVAPKGGVGVMTALYRRVPSR